LVRKIGGGLAGISTLTAQVVPLVLMGTTWAVNEAVKRAGIKKHVSCHTLRHSCATHLLEMGMDIMTIKELLGHERIETTLVYLHVAQSGRLAPFSPLDKLYQRSATN
jgi:integrase/recombinase XerD